jgi:tRNA modification GTPase
MTDDTIVAIATAYGVGSIAIIRLSGPNSLQIAKAISQKNDFTPRLATLSKLYSNQNIIDEVIVIYFKAPFSFTGEDIVEFQCHGGIGVAKLILNECITQGARVANSGEFSKRAFLNGKIDVSKAEAIAKLIESKSEDSVKLIAKHLKGDLKLFVDDIRDRLINILAFSEVSIDYSDEDLPDDIIDSINNQVSYIDEKLTKTISSSKQRSNIIDGFKVAIIGKPNVGKSSLMNKLLNYDRAIVSNIAGTTRDTIEENITIGTNIIKIIDTAGIRETNDTIEQIGIQKSQDAIESADIVIVLFDNSKKEDDEDKKIISILEEYKDKKEIIVFINKIDLQKEFDETILKSFEYSVISCDENIDMVIKKLENILSKNSLTDEILLISNRQIEATQKTFDNLQESKLFLQTQELELFSFYINEAIQNISSIVKEYEQDEMFDKMFSNFCLGK